MTSPETTGGCGPTSTQELLLRACLVDGPQALIYWQQWQERTDIEHLDDGSSRLLPLLWRNLNKQGAQGKPLARYKSMSRWIWARNQRLLGAAASVIELLESQGISTLVLKGGALATLYYPSLSARPMNDFDLLVPTAQAPRALELLMRRGYLLETWGNSELTDDIAQIKAVLSVFHGAMVCDPKGQKFDLHSHVLWNSHDRGANDAFWDASIALKIGDVQTRALCAEDAFFHVCAHGARWNEVPPLRWIADAALILRASPNFNWNRVVERCRHHKKVLPVRHAMHYLSQLDADIPFCADAMRELQRVPTSRAQRREWSAVTRSPTSRSMALSLWLRGRAFAQWNAQQDWHQRPFGLLRYLQFFWGLASRRQLPAKALKGLRKHWIRGREFNVQNADSTKR